MNYKLLPFLFLLCLVFCSCHGVQRYANITSESSTTVNESDLTIINTPEEDNSDEENDVVYDPSDTGNTFFEEKNFSITLPDTNWELSEQENDLTAFQSDYGFMDITRATGEDNESILLPSSKQELNALLKESFPDVDFKILDFKSKKEKNGIQHLFYSIHYNGGEAAYNVTNIYYTPATSYTVTAMLTSESKEIFKEVKSSLKTFKGNF